jgi:hypothetical protein
MLITYFKDSRTLARYRSGLTNLYWRTSLSGSRAKATSDLPFVATSVKWCTSPDWAEAEGLALRDGLRPSRPRSKWLPPKHGWPKRRTLLLLDDIWENDVMALAPDPPVSLLCTSRRRSLLPWISLTHSLEVKSFSCGEAKSIFRIYLGAETVETHRDGLFEFAERVERLPIAIVVSADLLRRELDPVSEVARGLRLERLRNEVHNGGGRA